VTQLPLMKEILKDFARGVMSLKARRGLFLRERSCIISYVLEGKY